MGRDISRNIIGDFASLRDVMLALNKGIYGVVLVVRSDGVMCGILTDGDVRRALLNGATLDSPASEHMNTNFVFGSTSNSHEENINLLSDKIRHLPILDTDGRPVDLISWAEIWQVPVSVPYLGGNELKYVSDCIDSGWVSSQGHYVKRFEKMFGDYCSAFAVTTSSGTAALHLALVALGIGAGDEVIVPDITFAASANVVVHCGATPIFVDVSKKTWTMNPMLLEELITERTRAIMPVHLYGHPCDMDPIIRIARKNSLFVVEDCAEALGARYKSRLVGTIGDVGCFSFFANKVITTGEGGMVVTRNKELMEKISMLRDHGMSRQRKYWHELAGFNYRMTNIQAAIGVAQMENLDRFLENRKVLAKEYTTQLSNMEEVTLPYEENWAESICWLYSILIDKPKVAALVEKLIKEMKVEGIETRPLFYPLHQQPPYFFDRSRSFPVSEWLSKKGISLPTSNDMTVEDVGRVCRAFKSVLENLR